MERVILHCDLNNFYASVECMENPQYKTIPFAVAGNPKLRHGIILAKNQIAKEQGIKTGDVIWQAQQMCKGLVVIGPSYHEYIRYSDYAKEIYSRFSDRIEPYGIDEAWVDVSESVSSIEEGKVIADKIRKLIWEELGLTASVGVSFNKIYAKLGSDYKKPNATTVFSKDNYKDFVYPLPVGDLLYVGRQTVKKLHNMGISTIGDLANAPFGLLKQKLGKWGEYLWLFASGNEQSDVMLEYQSSDVKSIGNGITTPKDVISFDEAKHVTYVLCESIATRLKKQHFLCSEVSIHLRNTRLYSFSRQMQLVSPTNLSDDIAKAVHHLMLNNYDFKIPLRSITVQTKGLLPEDAPRQLTVFEDQQEITEKRNLEYAMEDIRRRFGNFSVQRCSMLVDEELTHFDPLSDHTIHPYNYFR